MHDYYDALPILNVIVDIRFNTDVTASVDLTPSNVNRPLTNREIDFKLFLEAIYKQLRDDNGGCLDIVENHYTDRSDKVSNYIFGYFVSGKFTGFQYLIELRISDHPTTTTNGRRKFFRKMSNDWDMIKTHDPDDYKNIYDHNNARYIPIDVDIHTQWTTNTSNIHRSPDVEYLSYNSYQDALNDLHDDILELLKSIPQLGVLGYKNHVLYKTKHKDEYVVYKDSNRRNVLISGTLEDVCAYIDSLSSSVTSSVTILSSKKYINDTASCLEADLDAEFSEHAPFRCVKMYEKHGGLVICVVDSDNTGYEFTFDHTVDYTTILSEFFDAFDESYQYDYI